MNTYVYGVVASTHPRELDGVTGVGSPSAPVRAVEAGDLIAVVSDAPEQLRAKRRDLLAHEAVLERLCAQGATLPMQFGIVGQGDAAVAEEVSRNAQGYSRLLDELADRVEINVKARHLEDAVLQHVLLNNDALRRRNEQMQREGGGTYDERLQFGEQVSEAVQAREGQDSKTIIDALAPFAVRHREGPAVDGAFVNASFLVERSDVEAFDAAVTELSNTWAELFELRARGPLPPYSFTDPAEAGAARTR
ncbi:hypothetical protein EIL87_06270 [Saccharopolyspora rhizosphaerae]|uniref:GvpL/GvpF family gas vesicle protein n=1 Tax=Saccharopolyspora rhizosphaerae TaxID=2492662 RepID=A0A426K038_9PSEU|nr:GvpL/GvpF family gas vesicle protein [Saccharopolyspora rhizosphaerae]RRO18716.1 hypothetical protein EIL87_06270 [Saccharopolyspora rhizosphaerae]